MTAPVPNSRDVIGLSRGIARNMQLDGSLLAKINAFNGPGGRFYTPPGSFQAIPDERGGGDLNGSACPALMLGQAGTGCIKIDVPRKLSQGNYCGTV